MKYPFTSGSSALAPQFGVPRFSDDFQQASNWNWETPSREARSHNPLRYAMHGLNWKQAVAVVLVNLGTLALWAWAVR